MPSPYLVDNTAGDDTTGDGSLLNPWKTMGKALTVATTAGDIVYLSLGVSSTGEVLASTHSIVTAGANATPCKWIGVSRVTYLNDGTMYALDGNSASASAITNTANFVNFENIEVFGCTGNGITVSGTIQNLQFKNCISRNNGGNGFTWASGVGHEYYKCKAYNNTGIGFSFTSGSGNKLVCCESYANSNSGISWSTGTQNIIVNCIIRDNSGASGQGINYTVAISNTVLGCIIDGNEQEAIKLTTGKCIVLYSRITNNGYRFGRGSAGIYYEDCNYYTNTTDNGSTAIVDSLYGRSATAGTEGYVDRTAKNFALTRAATNISIAEIIGGHYDGLTTAYVTSGLPRIEPTLPAVGTVGGSTQYGDAGTELTGTRTDADPDYVLSTQSTFGDPSSPFTPNFINVDEADVEAGVTWGPGGTGFTGTLMVPNMAVYSVTVTDTDITVTGFGFGATQASGTITHNGVEYSVDVWDDGNIHGNVV